MSDFNETDPLEVKTGVIVKLHTGGKILINQAMDHTAVELPSGDLIKWLHGVVQFNSRLRVRDLFKLLINYPEVISLFPSFAGAIEAYAKLPAIGCCDQKVAFIGIKRERIIDSRITIAPPYTDAIMRLCIELNLGVPSNGNDELFYHDDPAKWLDMKLFPLRSAIEIVEESEEVNLLTVVDNYTVYDVLSALNYSLENEILLL